MSDFNTYNQNTLISQTAKVFARCFKGEDGEKALNHLHSITTKRVFGPEAKSETLYFAEGQKALVAHIEALISNGRSSAF